MDPPHPSDPGDLIPISPLVRCIIPASCLDETENASLRALCTQIADEYPKSNKGVFMPLKPKFPLFSLLNQEI
jgi:hypothetical protein